MFTLVKNTYVHIWKLWTHQRLYIGLDYFPLNYELIVSLPLCSIGEEVKSAYTTGIIQRYKPKGKSSGDPFYSHHYFECKENDLCFLLSTTHSGEHINGSRSTEGKNYDPQTANFILIPLWYLIEIV